ncbi:MAG: hypothetical protein CR958_00150 [Rhodobacterales bacterium]|nr:MAG: hypothetical protein CR958_00150 [Rhodobacterales bacterium]
MQQFMECVAPFEIGQRFFADAQEAVKEMALAHTNPNKVESAYLRAQYLHEREELMEVWGAVSSGG